MKYFLNRPRRGFTLVEVVIVVGIVGLLSAIVLFSVQQARQNARDKTRKVDLKQLQLALELYREAVGRYPENCDTGQAGVPSATTPRWASDAPGGATDCIDGNDWIIGLAPTFIATLPSDPKPPNNNMRYWYGINLDGSEYKVIAFNTVETSQVSLGDEFFPRDASCANPNNWGSSYAIWSDPVPGDGTGSECW